MSIDIAASARLRAGSAMLQRIRRNTTKKRPALSSCGPATHIRRRRIRRLLPQNRDDLLLREPAFGHRPSSLSATDSTSSWPIFRGLGHRSPNARSEQLTKWAGTSSWRADAPHSVRKSRLTEKKGDSINCCPRPRFLSFGCQTKPDRRTWNHFS